MFKERWVMIILNFCGFCWKSKREIFDSYLRYGSFPYVAYLENDEKVINQYIEGIYNTILIKDVATREKINDVSVLENILKTVASSIGSPISTKKISDTLISSGRKISPNTVEAYLRALTDSFILYNATRYDIKGRQFLKTLGKYYFVDSGIRNFSENILCISFSSNNKPPIAFATKIIIILIPQPSVISFNIFFNFAFSIFYLIRFFYALIIALYKKK